MPLRSSEGTAGLPRGVRGGGGAEAGVRGALRPKRVPLVMGRGHTGDPAGNEVLLNAL